MTMNFGEFIRAHRSGQILQDAGWRAYNIEGMMTHRREREALKQLGIDAGDHAWSSLAKRFGLRSDTEAKQMAGLWWTWRRIALGQMGANLKKRSTGNE